METTDNFIILYPHAAGIDCGSKEHVVAIGQHKERDVKRFGTFTENLIALCVWLKENHITHVAIESTGSYWQVLYFMLYDYDMTPFLVQPNHVKNPVNEKTDPKDARWLQKLMSCGLLNNSFQPDDETEELRTLMRERKSLVQQKTRCVQKMNKMLLLMNIRLDQVQCRNNNKGPMRIIEAICNGERNPNTLMQLFYRQGKAIATEEQKLMSLHGQWNDEYIFVMKEELNHHRFIEKQIASFDKRIVKMIETRMKEKMRQNPKLKNYHPVKKTNNTGNNDVPIAADKVVYTLSGGIDIGAIYGVGNNLLLTLLSEVGLDLKSKFKTEKQFVSWLHLCPNLKMSGGKILSGKTRHYHNALKTAFRDSANRMKNSANFLGVFFRRVQIRKGYKCAVTATARKLAIVVYRMLTRHEQFMPVTVVA